MKPANWIVAICFSVVASAVAAKWAGTVVVDLFNEIDEAISESFNNPGGK
jgi:hypothetical protein